MAANSHEDLPGEMRQEWTQVATCDELETGKWQMQTDGSGYWNGKVVLQCEGRTELVQTYRQGHNFGLCVGNLGGTLELSNSHVDLSSYTTQGDQLPQTVILSAGGPQGP